MAAAIIPCTRTICAFFSKITNLIGIHATAIFLQFRSQTCVAPSETAAAALAFYYKRGTALQWQAELCRLPGSHSRANSLPNTIRSDVLLRCFTILENLMQKMKICVFFCELSRACVASIWALRVPGGDD